MERMSDSQLMTYFRLAFGGNVHLRFNRVSAIGFRFPTNEQECDLLIRLCKQWILLGRILTLQDKMGEIYCEIQLLPENIHCRYLSFVQDPQKGSHIAETHAVHFGISKGAYYPRYYHADNTSYLNTSAQYTLDRVLERFIQKV